MKLCEPKNCAYLELKDPNDIQSLCKWVTWGEPFEGQDRGDECMHPSKKEKNIKNVEGLIETSVYLNLLIRRYSPHSINPLSTTDSYKQFFLLYHKKINIPRVHEKDTFRLYFNNYDCLESSQTDCSRPEVGKGIDIEFYAETGEIKMTQEVRVSDVRFIEAKKDGNADSDFDEFVDKHFINTGLWGKIS